MTVSGHMETDRSNGCSCEQSRKTGLDRSFVYAIGRIHPVFPSRGLEREYQQIVAGTEIKEAATEAEVMHSVLSRAQYQYLTRKLWWTFSVEGIDTYVLAIRHQADLHVLIESLRAARRPRDVDVLIGTRDGIASRHVGHAGHLPLVMVDHAYSFDTASLLHRLESSRPGSSSDKRHSLSAEELFDRVVQLADNAGNSDEHRALNYLAVRYDGIYHKTADAYVRNMTLAGVEVRPSRLSGTRNIVDVILKFADRMTLGEERWFVRVDVTDQFPFVVTPLTQYFER